MHTTAVAATAHVKLVCVQDWGRQGRLPARKLNVFQLSMLKVQQWTTAMICDIL
jgi:hypothetical protein